jgi:hypothetical protein
LTFPTTIVPARSHYLVAGAGYGLSSYAAANSTLAADIPDGAGVALFNSVTTFDASTRLDAVGFSGVGDATTAKGWTHARGRRHLGRGVQLRALHVERLAL